MTRTTAGMDSRCSLAATRFVPFVWSAAEPEAPSGGYRAPAYFCFQQINIALQPHATEARW